MIAPRAQARIFMAGDIEPDGENVCVSCGRPIAGQPIRKTLSNAFNQTELFLFPGMHICQGCQQLFSDKDCRCKCLFYLLPGGKTIIDREEVLGILLAPPKTEFVLSLPYSFKKHHFLFAELSNAAIVTVGTDNSGIQLDYVKHDVPEVIRTVGKMLTAGVPRPETITGAYSILTRARFGEKLNQWERIIAPLRNCGGVELFVRFTPAIKEKIVFEKEETVFTPTERQAADLLANIAGASLYRQENGLVFWKSFFIRRIQRFSSLDCHSFCSALCGACSCPASDQGFVTRMISDMTEEEENAVMEVIRTETDLLTAAAFTVLKDRQGKK